MICDLVSVGRVEGANVGPVIKIVSEGLGVEIDDKGIPSAHSAGRIVSERYIAEQLNWLMRCIKLISVDFTISGDGTSHKHTQYESKHITLPISSYKVSDAAKHCSVVPATRFYNISSALNHTSKMQLAGWEKQFKEQHALWNESPLVKHRKLDWHELLPKLKGILSDHAEDQKKLARLMKTWKTHIDCELRGEEVLLEKSSLELLTIISGINDQKFKDAGGIDAWCQLPHAEQIAQDEKAWKDAVVQYGKNAFNKLSDEAKDEAELWVWGGCCMHKDLNAVKGGNTHMMEFWSKNGLEGPIKLMNCDNAAAASLGPSEAKKFAEDHSQAGGVKVADIAGHYLNNHNKKKVQQDTFVHHFLIELGFLVHFPDTSNTCYQSHCDVAVELLVHLQLYISFLGMVRVKKDKCNFNHMESNLYMALHNIPTITELCVLALYAQAVGHPYIQYVHDGSKNILDLGKLHARVKNLCQVLIANPDLLLAADASWSTGTLDGKPWHCPNVFYVIQALKPSLPHLSGALVAFFTGALETWECFTAEFNSDGNIARLSQHQREAAFMPTTNDANEGSLGSMRQQFLHHSRLSLHAFNARHMWKVNNTKGWMTRNATSDVQAFMMQKARELDMSGSERKQKQELVEADLHEVGSKWRKDEEKRRKQKQYSDQLEKVDLWTDIKQIYEKNRTNAELDDKLEKHRQLEIKVGIPKDE
ncbi:hypothetical protein NEOLEDRAFT_1158276 [Neolentinus lepideus HHB14362 ss-1]|uniref:Uncharacterized protein n=1 Tax=Neolentinus lepideus HHB14362 ss-1 TaxID=1314782 RepID=A0A165PLL8_9AGAM|nr:hypothetical protein NEOLEDRAFT_1158276 [Neolentinus lepideus HHB14362 ss-1]